MTNAKRKTIIYYRKDLAFICGNICITVSQCESCTAKSERTRIIRCFLDFFIKLPDINQSNATVLLFLLETMEICCCGLLIKASSCPQN